MIFSKKLGFFSCRKNQKFFFTFKIFKARLENDIGKTIKALRTDYGGKYCSEEFEVLCVEDDI